LQRSAGKKKKAIIEKEKGKGLGVDVMSQTGKGESARKEKIRGS